MRLLRFLTRLVIRHLTLALIIFLGLMLRFIGTNPGYYTHGDEIMFGSAVRMILKHTLTTDVLGYPPLVPWIMMIFFVTIFLPLESISQLLSGHDLLMSQLIGKNWINAMFWGRYVTAFFGAGAILMTFLVAQKYYRNHFVSLLAAFLVAVNYRLVLNSRIGFPDTYNVFFFLVAVWLIGRLMDGTDWKRYFWAVLGSCLFILVKYQFYIILPFGLMHLWVSVRGSKNLKNFLVRVFNWRVILLAIVGVIFLLVTHIQYFMEWSKVVSINQYEAIKYSFGRDIINVFPLTYYFHVGWGVGVSIFALIGLVVGIWLKRLRLETLILASSLIIPSYLYLYYTGGGFFTRNLMALIPIVCIFAALALVKIKDFLKTYRFMPSWVVNLLVLFVFGLAVWPNLANSIISARIYSQPSSYTLISDWVKQQNFQGLVYGAYGGDPAPEDWKRLTPPSQAFSPPEIADEGYDIATIDITVIQDEFLWWMMQPTKLGLKFWNKPNDLLSQGFFALATREYLWSYNLKSIINNWQAPGFGFIVADVRDDNQNISFSKINYFDNFPQNWNRLAYISSDSQYLQQQDSQLEILANQAIPGSIRWQSDKFSVMPLHKYKVTAQVKNEVAIAKSDRSGFLRLDFYNQEFAKEVTSRPEISFVSKRIYGPVGWSNIEVIGKAPADAKYLTVSFQAEKPASPLILKSLNIFLSQQKFAPDLQQTVSDDNLFLYNNGGIL